MKMSSRLSVVCLVMVWLVPSIAMALLADNSCRTMSTLETGRIYGGASFDDRCCEWQAKCFYDENSSWCQPHWGELECNDRTGDQEHSNVNHDACTGVRDGELCLLGDNQVTCKSVYYCLYNEMAMQCTTGNVEFSSEKVPNFCIDTCFAM